MTENNQSTVERTALVGGGAGGIGAATAAALLAAGHRVVLAGRTGHTLAATAAALGGGVDHLVCDLADPAAATAAVAEVRARHGSLDVLVVNAGGPAPGRILAIADDQWHHNLDLLVLGPLALLRAALPPMAKRGFGRVVVIGSTAVRQPQPGLAASTVLRSAMTAAAKLAAREYAHRGVTVNTVAPGATDTPRRLAVLRARARAAGLDLATAITQDQAEIPAARAADPAEIAAAVAYLASPAAGYVNGTVLTVDGGRTEHPG
ncbi:SDR family oxidoreductase [Crossiella cryophila]|uniref:3-oxoacyl-[acyl-carrier protein] reductase n=1 Tax=Crossiella cryophila TaxID=43355 RepID=A0A7W7CCM7_9PSEU|nr:SDR family oxidoreductase [Crossiella cryophila]MBB4678660.1 3-oxoacyl-[acyl-carrier protein] reductase [Crossiella cryophila]